MKRSAPVARHWLPVLTWMMAIVIVPYFILLPLPVGDEAGPALRFELVRFTIHAAEYAILALLLVRALNTGQVANPVPRVALGWRTVWLVLFIVVLYGAIDELQQGLAPNRQPSPWDLSADAAGGVLALVGLSLTYRRRSRPTA